MGDDKEAVPGRRELRTLGPPGELFGKTVDGIHSGWTFGRLFFSGFSCRPRLSREPVCPLPPIVVSRPS